MSNVKEILEDFLSRGVIFILVDSNVEGVVLPKHLMNEIQVKLNLSYRFRYNIFEIDDKNVTVDLSFGGVRHVCVIPLHSIYYVASQDDHLNGVEITENMPIELLELSNTIANKNEDRKSKDKDAPPVKFEDVDEEISKAILDRQDRARKARKTIPGPNMSGPNRSKSAVDTRRSTDIPKQNLIVHHIGKRGKNEREQ